MGSLDSYLAVLIVLVLGALFIGGSLTASKLLAPQRPTTAKDAPYECGIVPTYELPNRYPVRFYLVAMIFIIFDIEVIFLFPWAVVFNQLGLFGLAEILVFAGAVFFSLVYLISNGGLDWGPVRRVRPLVQAEAALARRTTASTVRRVGSGSGSGEAA
ncbi:MAG TPA: NADH-quinone oxidoreductase subunit A [Acidimicrobiales bacterium]|nr:NADH-quinone oxidoreductase subunit A [Acidimicrobiales bacterium]